MHLELVGDFNLNTETKFQGVLVGGLSGIDYNSKLNRLVSISDDRAQRGPARLYELDFQLTKTPVTFQVKKQINLKDEKSKPIAMGHIDAEGIRLLNSGNYLISTEGDSRQTLLPTESNVLDFNPSGSLIRKFSIPISVQHKARIQTGTRNNRGFEALAVSLDEKTVLVASESSLAQDFNEDQKKAPQPCRVLVYQKSKNSSYTYQGSFVYKIDRLYSDSLKSSKLKGEQGLVELTFLNSETVLALERGYIKNHNHQINRIYSFKLPNPEQLKKEGSTKTLKKIKKTLILDLDQPSFLKRLSAGFQSIDNLEGMTVGPKRNGKKTLILASDNNFSESQRTQFLVFTIHP